MSNHLSVLFIGQSGAEAVEAELKQGGFEPTFRCVNKPEKLQEAIKAGCDIAICDAVTGELGALAALKAIQEKAVDLPLIVISGKIKDSDVLAALKAGAADHMTRSNLMRLN